MISLSSITIPTPQPYDKTQPERQRENLSYVLLQILQEAKAANDDDPFGLLGALQQSAATVQVELEDLAIKVFGQAAIIESI